MNEIKTLFFADGKTIKDLFMVENDLVYLGKIYKHVSSKFDKSYIKDYVSKYEVRINEKTKKFDVTICNESEIETMLDEELNTLIFEAAL